MRFTSVCLAALFGSATLSAQIKLGESPSVLLASPTGSGCPIGVVAERRSPSALVTAGETAAMGLKEGIKLGFQSSFSPNLEQVTVVVHGLSGKSHLTPTAAGKSSDVEETFELTRASKIDKLSHAYIRLETVRTTQWIELTRIEFADGSSWVPSSGSRCTVTPSKLVLVSDH